MMQSNVIIMYDVEAITKNLLRKEFVFLSNNSLKTQARGDGNDHALWLVDNITRQIVNANPPLQRSYPYPLSNNGYETLTSLLNNPNSSKGLYNNLNEIMYYKNYNLDARIVESFSLTLFDYYKSKDSK